MVRSLWTAATGMNSQQANIDTVANNLANVNTSGFKKQRAEFEDHQGSGNSCNRRYDYACRRGDGARCKARRNAAEF